MLTPLDIDYKTFKKTKLGGYDINDVEDFLITVMDDYEKLYKENAELKDKINAMGKSVSYYKSVEEGITKTIESAQEQADNIKDMAVKEAMNIKEKAELDAKMELEEIKNKIKQAENLYEEKKRQMQVYTIRVKAMLEAQLQILKEDNDENKNQ